MSEIEKMIERDDSYLKLHRFLMKKRQEKNLKNFLLVKGKGRNILHHAVIKNRYEIALLLLRFIYIEGISFMKNETDSFQKKPIHYCSTEKMRNLFLLEDGQEFNVFFFKYHHINGVKNCIVRGEVGSLTKFRVWAKKKKWKMFSGRVSHYDWWMFPINNVHTYYRETFVVSDVVEWLKNDDDYVNNYKEAMSLYMRSLGWNLEKKSFTVKKRKVVEMFDHHLVRLGKILDSLMIFGMIEEFSSVYLFYRHIQKLIPEKYSNINVFNINALVLVCDGSNLVETSACIKEFQKNGIFFKIARVSKVTEKKNTTLKSGNEVRKIEVDLHINQVKEEDFHFMVIPGGDIIETFSKCQKFSILVGKFLGKKYISAICSAPVLLMKQNCFKGDYSSITFYPSYESICVEMKIKNDLSKSVVNDKKNKIITGKSFQVSQEFAEKVCNTFVGKLL